MKSNYVFFIGGSGARTFKAFLHACSSGAVREREVRVMLLDADTGNAACKECEELYKLYKWHYAAFHEGKAQKARSAAFACKVTLYHDRVVSPVPMSASNLKMVVQGSADGLRALRWFYDSEERRRDLSRGFYAHPNIGCIFFQNFSARQEELQTCLQSIASDLEAGADVQVAIAGSVFGGTGAAGIPSVLSMVRDYCAFRKISTEKLRFGGVLITPYFKTPPESPDDRRAGGRRAVRTNGGFQENTLSALHYYDFMGQFEETYLVGKHTLDVVSLRHRTGGMEQNNKPHIVEVFAAMAVKNFLQGTNRDSGAVFTQILPGENESEKIGWDFLGFDPDFTGLADMLRTQALLETCVYPYVQEKINGNSKIGSRQWYLTFRMEQPENQAAMENIRAYTERFLQWMYCLQSRYVAGDGEKLAPDSQVALCGEAIGVLWDYIFNEHSPSYDKKLAELSLKTSLRKFDSLVQTGQSVAYVVKKAPVLLSELGVAPRFLAASGAAGLFLRLFELSAEKKS